MTGQIDEFAVTLADEKVWDDLWIAVDAVRDGKYPEAAKLTDQIWKSLSESDRQVAQSWFFHQISGRR